jgi:hypothetical protein
LVVYGEVDRMGVQADPVSHAPKPEVARVPTAPEREVWQPIYAAPGLDRSPQSALPPLGAARPDRHAQVPQDILRRVECTQVRRRLVLQMQRTCGNNCAARAIERSRAIDRCTDGCLDTDLSTGVSSSGQARSVAGEVNRDGDLIQRDLLDDLGGIVDKGKEIAGSAVDTVTDVAGDLVEGAKDLAGGVIAELRSAYDTVAGQISAAWETLKGGIESAVTAAIEEATGFLGGIGAFFSGVGAAIVGLDAEKLRSAWSAITNTAGMVLGAVKGVATRVLAVLDGKWADVKGMADGLIGGLRGRAEGLIGKLPGPVQGTARSIWNGIEKTATSAWSAIEQKWTSIRKWASEKIDAMIAGVERIVAAVDESVIAPIVDTLSRLADVFKIIKQAVDDPESFIRPLAQAVTGMLQELPSKAKSEAQTRINAGAAGGPVAAAGPATAGPTPAPAPAPPVQRAVQRDAVAVDKPRTTLGVGEAVSHVWDALVDKVTKLWGNLGETVKEMLLSMVYPPATWKALKQDWHEMTTELAKRASRFASIRTDSFANFWEDLSRFISNLVDFPLIIWRSLNAMLGRLSVYIGLAIILGGAIGGAIAGGTGGAVFGGILGAGAGAAPGGAAGVAAGAWAGIQAGYALAESIGLVLLASFVGAEGASIVKSVEDLLFVPQSEEEQHEDVNQIADSTIAVVAAGLLMAIAFVGVAIAKRIWALAKAVFNRFRPRPLKPTVVDPAAPKPVDVPGKASKVIICRTCVELKNVPNDILARRANLSPEMQQFLDEKLNGFVKDPLNPTAAEFDRLRKMMDGIEKANGGDLEAGLKAAKARETPAVKSPFGSGASELPRLRNAAEQLLAEIDDFAAKNPDKQTIRRAGQRLKNDMEGVLKDMETGKTEATPERIEGFENNLKGVQGEFDAAKAAPPGTQFGVKKSGIEIDEISPDGLRWKNEKNFNLFGENDPRVLDLEAQAKNTITVAQLPENAVGGKVPQVEFHFGKGVTPEVAAKLRKVNVNGQSLIVTGPEMPLKP